MNYKNKGFRVIEKRKIVGKLNYNIGHNNIAMLNSKEIFLIRAL